MALGFHAGRDFLSGSIMPNALAKVIASFMLCITTFLAKPSFAQSVAQYNYDARGRIVSTQDGIGSSSTYQYDAAGNRAQVTTALQFSQSWLATDPSIGHRIGRQDDGGWSATVNDPRDHLVFGPYTRNVPAGARVAAYRMMVDNNTADNLQVVQLDVCDSTAGVGLATRSVSRMEWKASSRYQVFELPFQLDPGSVGHALEFRIYYMAYSYVRVYFVGYR